MLRTPRKRHSTIGELMGAIALMAVTFGYTQFLFGGPPGEPASERIDIVRWMHGCFNLVLVPALQFYYWYYVVPAVRGDEPFGDSPVSELPDTLWTVVECDTGLMPIPSDLVYMPLFESAVACDQFAQTQDESMVAIRCDRDEILKVFRASGVRRIVFYPEAVGVCKRYCRL